MKKPLTAFFLLLAPALVGAAPERFDPESHFPKDCFVYVSLNPRLFLSGLKETPMQEAATGRRISPDFVHSLNFVRQSGR